jgi:hypothetical protein
MASWTTQDLALPARTAEGVVSKEFLNRDPQYMVVEILGLSGDPGNLTIEDSADGQTFTAVKAGGSYASGKAILRFDASVETAALPIRNICRVKIANAVTFDRVLVTWSP